jgi:O-antigen/teichoic acid export membrane protein
MFRDVVRSVARNTSIMFVQLLITWSSSFLLMLFLPRYLGPVEYGRIFVASSTNMIFGIFVQYSGNYWVAKNVSRFRSSTGQILVDAVAYRFILGIACLGAMMLFGYVIGYSSTVQLYLFIMGIGLLWQGASTTLTACFQGHEVMQYTSAGVITQQVFVSLVSVAALLMGASAVVIVIIGVSGGFLSFLVLSYFSRKIVTSLPRVDWRGVRRQMKEGLPYLLFGLFSTFYYRINSVILAKMVSDDEVGWFGAAYRLFEIMNFLPSIFSVAVYPVLSRLWKEEVNIHRRTTQKGLEFMIMAGVPISILLAMFAEHLVSLFYASQYVGSIIVLQVLAVGLVFLYVDMILGTTLIASDKQKNMSFISLAAIPISVGLNLLLIRYFQQQYDNGGIGAAIATGATEIVIMSFMLASMPKGIFTGFRKAVIVKVFMSGVLMTGTLSLMATGHVNWIVAGLIGSVVYCVGLFLLKTFEAKETEYLLLLLSIRNLRAFANLLGLGKTNDATIE